jgi:hypothetical protein
MSIKQKRRYIGTHSKDTTGTERLTRHSLTLIGWLQLSTWILLYYWEIILIKGW